MPKKAFYIMIFYNYVCYRSKKMEQVFSYNCPLFSSKVLNNFVVYYLKTVQSHKPTRRIFLILKKPPRKQPEHPLLKHISFYKL